MKFSRFDAKNGFWQIPLEEEFSRLTTFATLFGHYKFKRMPYGIKSEKKSHGWSVQKLTLSDRTS